MAGSNSTKLRVQNVKTRTELKILLHCSGRRVNSDKAQGLFSKKAGADRSFPSVDSGRFVLGRWIWIARSRARGRGRAAAGDQTRGGAAPVSPVLSKVGRPGLVWLGFWPGSTSAGCATHWGG